MHRVICAAKNLKVLSTLRNVSNFPQSRIFRRNLAWLTEDNEYLPGLLAKNGLAKFLRPLDSISPGERKEASDSEGKDQSMSHRLIARFSIDRDEICIRCKLALIENPDNSNSKRTEFNGKYPPYDSQTNPPSIQNLDIDGSPKTARIREFVDTLWRAFCVNDFLSLKIEVTVHPDGNESAVHRQENIFKHVTRNEHPDELEAEKSLLVYRRFPGGNIGTIANGAGLSMATNDTIDLLYGRSANFLDVGGKATPETIKEAFRLVLKNHDVNVILVNIFGGCLLHIHSNAGVIQGDMIAKGILSAVESLRIHIPIVTRIQGTNGKLGMQMLANSEFKNIQTEDNLYDAVRLAIKLSKRKVRNGRFAQNFEDFSSNFKKEKFPGKKGSPFPIVYNLIHTSPAFRTKRGRIRPAVMTYAIEGQGNRRIRLTRPWRPGDRPLNTTIITLEEAKRLTKGKLRAIIKQRELENKISRTVQRVERGLEGPTAAFFKD